uniref:Uncharacterized protein n=1 Tax=viral metagenome TaxID=1070528 RepID=A0A6C0E1C3_9ZZZZ
MSCPDFTINTHDFISKIVEKLKLDNDCQTKMLSYFLNKNIQLDNNSLCDIVVKKIENIYNESKNIGCVITNSYNKNTTVVRSVNKVLIETTPLTQEELDSKNELINETLLDTDENIESIKSLMLDEDTKNLLIDNIKQMSDNSIESIETMFGRDIEGDFDIVQSAKTQVSVSSVINDDDKKLIDDANTKIAKEVIKYFCEKYNINYEKLDVDEKISNSFTTSSRISTSMDNENNLKISVAGNINLNGLKINQSIVAKLLADSIIDNSISSSILLASNIVQDEIKLNNNEPKTNDEPNSNDISSKPVSVPDPESNDIVPEPESNDIVPEPESNDIVPEPESNDIVPEPESNYLTNKIFIYGIIIALFLGLIYYFFYKIKSNNK